jgi:ribosome-binding protein aMBF1 (putative translation factor)
MKALDLRGRRQSVDVRIEPLAAELRLHQNTISDIERGRLGIDEDTYETIVATIDRLANGKSSREEVVVG